jgi:beta-lactamase class A
MNRREFNKAILAFGGLTLAAPWLSVSRASPGRYDVSYIWHPSLEDALDYMESVGGILGPTVRRKLRIVKGQSGNYGIIYDCNADAWKEASRCARAHSEQLETEGFDAATVIEDAGYDELYNIVYGKGPNLTEHKKNYATVAQRLGSDIKQRLVIEKMPDGEYALVYKRYGDKASSIGVLKRHNRLLNGTRVRASIIRENNNDIVYGHSSFLHESLESVREPEPPQQKADKWESNLEEKIEDYVKSARRAGRISSDEATSWSVYDFTSGTKLVTINEDVPRQCASMVKPFVALAFFHSVKHRRFVYGPKSRGLMERMIQHSSNSATNRLIDLIGGPSAVNKILHDVYPRVFRQTRIIERIPMGGRTYLNKASAHDYSRFLYALWSNRFPHSGEIRRLMALPNRDRLYDGVPCIPTGTLVYHKTGTTSRLCGDFGILAPKNSSGERHPYTLVAIIEKRRRASSLSRWIGSRGNVIRHVSSLVYDEMKRRYNLA